MAVKIWDAQSNAFKDAETPKIWDAEAGAYKDSTGLVWNESVQAWTERWNSGVSAYVYGAASETITIKKNGIIVATVDTDSTGQSVERITLSNGTYTLTGSVSGWTEEQTVDEDTEKFRAMPEGALYWYGNECTWITGSYEKLDLVIVSAYSPTNQYLELYKNTSDMKASISAPGTYACAFGTVMAIDITKYSKMYMHVMYANGSGAYNWWVSLGDSNSGFVSYDFANIIINHSATANITNSIVEVDVSAGSGLKYLFMTCQAGAASTSNVAFDKIWFE